MDENKTLTAVMATLLVISIITTTIPTTDMIEQPIDLREKYAGSAGTTECLHVTCKGYDGFDYDSGICNCYSEDSIVKTVKYY